MPIVELADQVTPERSFRVITIGLIEIDQLVTRSFPPRYCGGIYSAD
jgi:hypothetical protein